MHNFTVKDMLTPDSPVVARSSTSVSDVLVDNFSEPVKSPIHDNHTLSYTPLADDLTELSSPLEGSSSTCQDENESISPNPTISVPITLQRRVADEISVAMLALYEELLPTLESHEQRRKLVQKIERILNQEWPGHDIRAHLFGSSENDLGTCASDVDICLTTTWPGLQCLDTLAAALKKYGMQHLHTTRWAKVPILKMWDPTLQLACDMNVNSTLALQNTKMVKTYIAIDPRVRPLAMIIKHWTRQRALNDASVGGTLSTYTWTCMIINFLQMREPPILPVLHQMDHAKSPDNVVVGGHDTSFYSDVESLKGFGNRNQESLGGLLFAFFRRFAYEFDYETQVVSVRHGRYLSKTEKGWHQGLGKRLLCIEEPFNVQRNLGNSADDAAVYGLQREFRRAVHVLLETGSLDALCAPYSPPTYYVYPPLMPYWWQQQQQQPPEYYLDTPPLLYSPIYNSPNAWQPPYQDIFPFVDINYLIPPLPFTYTQAPPNYYYHASPPVYTELLCDQAPPEKTIRRTKTMNFSSSKPAEAKEKENRKKFHKSKSDRGLSRRYSSRASNSDSSSSSSSSGFCRYHKKRAAAAEKQQPSSDKRSGCNSNRKRPPPKARKCQQKPPPRAQVQEKGVMV